MEAVEAYRFAIETNKFAAIWIALISLWHEQITIRASRPNSRESSGGAGTDYQKLTNDAGRYCRSE
jgi:hypothetical protein